MTEIERAIKTITEHQQRFGKPIKYYEVTQAQFDKLKAETEPLRQYTFGNKGVGNSIMGVEIRVVDIDQLRTTVADITKQRDELLAELKHCAEVFRRYEQLHLLKCTDDGDDKAHSNGVLAARCEAAIARVKEMK